MKTQSYSLSHREDGYFSALPFPSELNKELNSLHVNAMYLTSDLIRYSREIIPAPRPVQPRSVLGVEPLLKRRFLIPSVGPAMHRDGHGATGK